MLHAADRTERIKLQLELCRYFSLRNVAALWIAIAAKEPAEAAATLRHLAAVLSAAHWAWKTSTLKRWCVARWRVVANHL